MTYLGKLPDDIYIRIYKIIFSETLEELKNTINCIQKNHYTYEIHTKLHKTLVNKYTNSIIYNNLSLYNFVNKNLYNKMLHNDIILTASWEIPIKSFQNHHIYTGIKKMEYIDLTEFDKTEDGNICDKYVSKEIRGDCWQDLYETANKLIKSSDDNIHCAIVNFVIINKTTIRLITSE